MLRHGKHSESGALEVGLVAGGDSCHGRHGVGTLEGRPAGSAGNGIRLGTL